MCIFEVINILSINININFAMSENVKPKASKYTKPAAKKPYNKTKTSKVARELEDVIKIVKYNANIKRHTALNIINTFVEDGFIPNGNGAFVDFQWNKYTVKHDGITKEYNYDKTFVTALVKAHEDMAKDNTKSIAAFVKFLNID